jgi:hypothetical protein
MKEIDQIKLLFDKLPERDKEELLLILQKEVKPKITIVEFAQFIQRMYKQNITFDVISVSGQIQAEVTTPFGKFTGLGDNKHIAKQEAVKVAFDFFNNSNQSKNDKNRD